MSCWGFLGDPLDLVFLAKHCLDKCERKFDKLKNNNNLSGKDWAQHCVKSHANVISNNIYRAEFLSDT